MAKSKSNKFSLNIIIKSKINNKIIFTKQINIKDLIAISFRKIEKALKPCINKFLKLIFDSPAYLGPLSHLMSL